MFESFNKLVSLYEGELINRQQVDMNYLKQKDDTIAGTVQNGKPETGRTAAMHYKAFATALFRRNNLYKLPYALCGGEPLTIKDYSIDYIPKEELTTKKGK